MKSIFVSIYKGITNKSCAFININNSVISQQISTNLQNKIIDCNGLSKMIENDFLKKIPIIMQKFNIENKPKLKIISVADNFDNKIYIENKIKACKLIGIEYEHISFSDLCSFETIKKEIELSNKDKKVSGVILQLPLSEKLNPFSTELLN